MTDRGTKKNPLLLGRSPVSLRLPSLRPNINSTTKGNTPKILNYLSIDRGGVSSKGQGWVNDKGWIVADELLVGDLLKTKDGKSSVIEEIGSVQVKGDQGNIRRDHRLQFQGC